MKIEVKVHPNSKTIKTEKDGFGVFQVYISEPPIEGKANKAIILALAKFLEIKKSAITLLRGEKSKSKIFEINQNQ